MIPSLLSASCRKMVGSGPLDSPSSVNANIPSGIHSTSSGVTSGIFAANGNDSSHDGLQIATVDCSARLLDSSLDADTFHALVTRNGEESLGDF
jgi:hypothetical protein